MFARGSKVYACTKREISMLFGSALLGMSANLLPRFERVTPAITARPKVSHDVFAIHLKNALTRRRRQSTHPRHKTEWVLACPWRCSSATDQIEIVRGRVDEAEVLLRYLGSVCG